MAIPRRSSVAPSKDGAIRCWWPPNAGACGTGDSREIGKRLTRDSVLAEVDRSLARLGIDTIDLYQIHWPEPDEEIEQGWSAVGDLVKAGKVRFAGVCNFSVAQLERVQPIHPVTSLQPPYSMLRREIEADLVPWCEAHRVGIVAYSPMQTGLLVGTLHEGASGVSRARRLARPAPVLPRAAAVGHSRQGRQLRPIASRLDITVAELALAWVLRLPVVTSAIVGARSPEQIEETVGAGEVVLPDDAVADIEGVLRS